MAFTNFEGAVVVLGRKLCIAPFTVGMAEAQHCFHKAAYITGSHGDPEAVLIHCSGLVAGSHEPLCECVLKERVGAGVHCWVFTEFGRPVIARGAHDGGPLCTSYYRIRYQEPKM